VTQQTLVSNIALMAGTNEDALEMAVREHARLVYRIAYSVLRNHHDAEDATQEAFIRALRYKRKLEGVQDPKMWLARIAWRVAVDWDKRRGKRNSEVPLSEAESENAILELRSQLSSAEEITLGNELAVLFASLVEALPGSLRDALKLSTVEELTPAEIAKILGTSEASVRSRLFRARQVLKEKFAALEGSYGNAR